MDPKAYLESIIPGKENVDRFVRPDNGAATFSARLGWLSCDRSGSNSVDGSRGFYHYDSDGARRVIHFRDQPCRIHTFGDSFTHCDQVSDGETWQEYIAAHFQEPVRNFGIGGYSVLQAYRRMRLVEAEAGAEYIILNIFDDDHFRNLDNWRSIHMGPGGRFTLPHVKVDVGKNRCEEVDNICQTPEDVYRLLDRAFVWDTYREDPVLPAILVRRYPESASPELLAAVADGFGMEVDPDPKDDLVTQTRKLHTEAALYATRYVLGKVESFIRETGKKLILMLSFNRHNMAAALERKPLFDQTFLDWLHPRDYPVIDMREVFLAEFQHFNSDVKTYLDRYYIGHHNPAGNFFTAWAIKDRVREWLDPAPLPYRPEAPEPKKDSAEDIGAQADLPAEARER